MSKLVQMISCAELQGLLGSKKLKILDCSVARGRQAGDCHRMNFKKQKIPGSLFLDLDHLTDKKTDLPYMMPPKD